MNKYETKHLRFKGDPKNKTYDSHDHVAGKPVAVKAGDKFDVSVDKADQMLEDFPHLFEEATKSKATTKDSDDEKEKKK